MAERLIIQKKTKRKIGRASKERNINNPNKIFCNTSIEQKIRKELEKRGFIKNKDFFQNKGVMNIANVDFFFSNYKIIIECDGCYYHNCPIHFPESRKEVRKNDKRKTKLLQEAGFIVYRFWEHDINKNAQQLVELIL
jgi:DNA mismatch endonuclease, patch repair protein